MRHHLEYALAAFVRTLVRVMPRRMVRAAGTGLGLAFYLFDGVHRRIALDNLAAAFPRRTPKERRAIIRAVFGHFGRLLFELLKFSLLTHDEMLAAVEFEGGDRVRQAYAQGRGVLLFTGHFGYWEIHAIAHGLQFAPMAVLARALDNPRLNTMLEQVRGCTGNYVIYRRGALRRVLRALGTKQAVAVLIDQHIQQPEAVYVDFFDRPAATTAALAALAFRTGAPVIPCFALPGRQGGYRLVYEHQVEPPTSDSPEAIREFTQRCTDVLEMYVRRHPELWLWMHRRWREVEGGDELVPGMFPRAGQPDIEVDA